MSICGPCGNYLCAQYGCQKTAPCPPQYQLPPTPTFTPPGCICPPTSEKTCGNPICPRKPIRLSGDTVSVTSNNSYSVENTEAQK